MSGLAVDGTTLAIGQEDVAAPTAYADDTFSTIGEVTDFTLGGRTRGLVDLTNVADTARQFTPVGAWDGGDSTFTVNYDPTDTGFDEVEDAFDTKQKRYLKVTLPDATVLYSTVFVTGIGEVTGSMADKFTRSFTCKTLTKWTSPA